ncbi:thiamine-phosphate kinase [Amphibacillus cookii]|uniref:thiamine-phosphate kinase n=1 Tax=Amphibacillus cookii TaxID=767787 RepID=UPI00195E1812|nr:thiamine-phosphate kinase [Amphibacillus cookii]MBM7543241.1 thiamine-monophosphate kinase [Amphibacillus cookii]
MDEFKFIQSIKQSAYRNRQIIKGVGDDAAVFREAYRDVVVAVDTFVENVHFTRQTMDPFHIGYRLLGANLSDMAAMGAEPISYLISIVVPTGWSDEQLKEVYRGLDTIAKAFKVDLIGGDTVSGQQFVLTVTINGAVEQGKARYRHDMRDKDVLFVTGTLGDSAAGLSILQEENNAIAETEYLIKRHRMPTPRVDFARGLLNLPRVALNDVSDGIASEANELAEASNLTVYIEEDAIPLSNPIKQFEKTTQIDYMLNGGEDFELIGAVAPEYWQVVKEIAEETNTSVTQIGTVKDQTNRNGQVYIKRQNGYQQLHSSGYVHRN